MKWCLPDWNVSLEIYDHSLGTASSIYVRRVCRCFLWKMKKHKYHERTRQSIFKNLSWLFFSFIISFFFFFSPQHIITKKRITTLVFNNNFNNNRENESCHFFYENDTSHSGIYLVPVYIYNKKKLVAPPFLKKVKNNV